MPIVGIHVHTAYTEQAPESFAGYMAANGGDLERFVQEFKHPERFSQLMDEQGIDYACILAEIAPATSGIASNELVRDFCAASPRLTNLPRHRARNHRRGQSVRRGRRSACPGG